MVTDPEWSTPQARLTKLDKMFQLIEEWTMGLGKWQALEILTGLRAAPAAAMIRRNLRAEGARGIPRGPRAATRHNPVGLTSRQVAILALLAEDLSNKEIATQLRIAPKTVDHHVCAVLAKLEVSSRKQAARHPVTRALRTEAASPVQTDVWMAVQALELDPARVDHRAC